MIKRLIFDIDGTLIRNVNFSEAITKTLNELKIYSKDNYDAFAYGIKTYENNYDNYNKEAYISACKDKKTEECLIIGDHLELDINIPRKLGINTIWITESNKKIEGIRISKISELIDIL